MPVTVKPLFAAMLALSIALLVPSPARAAQSQATPDDQILAESFAHLAQQTLAMRAITPETLRQSIALLEAAMRLNPDEPRFARLLAEAALQDGDVQRAIDAYNAIHRLEPNDRVAQIKLIDLHLSRMETADGRLNYVNNIAAAEKVPSEVRSHAAYRAARLYLERAQQTEATQKLDEALRLFPLSPEALKLKYELHGGAGTPRERVALLLTMLKSNPAQPGAIAQLARELAEVGLHEQAIHWYNISLNLGGAIGRRPLPQDVVQMIVQYIITGQSGETIPQIVANLLERDPTDVDAALLGLLHAARGGDNEAATRAAQAAEGALMTRASIIGQQLAGVENPTTQPAESINVADDVKKLLERGDPSLTAAYASTLADLAWVRLYFANKPAEAEQVLTHLRQLLPADSVTLARLEGWTFLLQGQDEEARVKLSAVADRDPLAQLGMIRLMEKEGANADRVTQDARKLMSDAPVGVVGAIVHDALRDKKPRLAPGELPPLTGDGEAVKMELDEFPREWLDLLDKPSKYYVLRIEPLRVTHEYGDPILVRITVQNISPYDITIGQDGAIRPDVWFQVNVRGLVQGGFDGIAFDRLGGQVLLKPQQKIVQNVRIDQAGLTQMMQQNATIAMPIYISAFNNPIALPQGIPVPGPGGQRVQSTRVVNRVGVPLDEKTLRTNEGRLVNGTPAEKMRAAELLWWFASILVRQENDQQKAKAFQLSNALQKTANDPDPQVRSYVSFMMGISPGMPPELRRKQIDRMLEDSAWEPRMLALLLTQSLPADQWALIAAPIAEGESDEVVKRYASAVVDFADNPAATQPATTQPAGETDAAEPVASP